MHYFSYKFSNAGGGEPPAPFNLQFWWAKVT